MTDINNTRIKLWEKDIPYYNENWGDEPCLFPFMAKRTAKGERTNACVIIAPGGGYENRCFDREGEHVANMFCENGISAFVLNYRVAPYSNPAMLEDVLRAVRVARREAANFGYDPHKIAVMGFSAGGHLASMALTHFDYGKRDGDETDRISSRPDAGILCYPVITLGEKTHAGSRRNLLGEKWQDEEEAARFSSEKAVREDTPPCFLFHTASDSAVPADNSMMMAAALMAKKIPVELHIFPFADHGMGMGQGPEALHAAQWVPLAVRYLKDYLA